MGYCNLCPGINYIPRVVCLLGLFIIVLLFLWPCVWRLCNVQNIGCIWLAAAPCRTYQSKLFKSKVSSRFLTKTKIDPSRSPIIRAVVFPCCLLHLCVWLISSMISSLSSFLTSSVLKWLKKWGETSPLLTCNHHKLSQFVTRQKATSPR